MHSFEIETMPEEGNTIPTKEDQIIQDRCSSHQPQSNTVSSPPSNTNQTLTPSPTTAKNTWQAIRYVLFSGAAVAATCLCPETVLRLPPQDALQLQPQAATPILSGFDLEKLAELILIYILLLIAFSTLYQSDPGYITAEMMNEWDDHASIDDNEKEEEAASVLKQQASLGSSSPRLRHNSSSIQALDQEEEDEMDPLTLSTFPESNQSTRTRRPFCEKCSFAPPLRSHHCKVCNQHVAMFDHHCDFIGTCIGERNHCRFWWFLTAQVVGFWIMTRTIGSSPYGFSTFLFHNNNYQDNAPELNRALVVVVAKLYVYPLSWVAYLVWVVHTFLALSNSTTFEFSKGSHLEYLRGTRTSDLPYSYNSFDKNVAFFCCQRDACCDSVFGQNVTNMWKPTLWHPPGKIVRDSEDWWEHPWQNKYWSCC